jgi:hypothetical protein
MPTPPQQPPVPSPAEPGGHSRPSAPRRDRKKPPCPLPDAAAMRLLRVPDPAPPYDMPCASARDTVRATVYGEPYGLLPQDPPDGTLPPRGASAAGQAPGGRPGGRGGGGEPPEWRPGSESGRDTAAPGSRRTGTDSTAPGSGHGGRGGGNGEPPDSRHSGEGGPAAPGWPGQFAQALAETLAGARPQRQLIPWTTEQARTRIQRLGAQLSAGQQPRLRRVITCSPARDVLEMTMIVGFGPRIRAVAVRLERTDPVAAVPGRPARPARWLCTAVEAA